jgi:hypothetical protein
MTSSSGVAGIATGTGSGSLIMTGSGSGSAIGSTTMIGAGSSIMMSSVGTACAAAACFSLHGDSSGRVHGAGEDEQAASPINIALQTRIPENCFIVIFTALSHHCLLNIENNFRLKH